MPDDNTDQTQTEQAKAAERVRQQVIDALELSRFVVATGVTDKDGKPLDFADIGTIQGAAASLGLLDVTPGSAGTAATAGGTATRSMDTGAWNELRCRRQSLLGRWIRGHGTSSSRPITAWPSPPIRLLRRPCATRATPQAPAQRMPSFLSAA